MTDEIAEATAQHRKSTSHISQILKRTADRKATRHTIANIKFSPNPFVVCSCEWRYYGDATESAWKLHKAEVGERHT